MINSHDPRMNRLGLPDAPATAAAKEALDQFETYEVFHQKKENAAYTYVGPVHAPEADVAFLFAKEQFSRRFACTGLWVVPTSAITVTAYVGDQESAYDTLPPVAVWTGLEPSDTTAADAAAYSAGEEDYDIFHLKKRGKAQAHVGKVRAASPADAATRLDHRAAPRRALGVVLCVALCVVLYVVLCVVLRGCLALAPWRTQNSMFSAVSSATRLERSCSSNRVTKIDEVSVVYSGKAKPAWLNSRSSNVRSGIRLGYRIQPSPASCSSRTRRALASGC